MTTDKVKAEEYKTWYRETKRREGSVRAEDIAAKLYEGVCDTCRLFGSPVASSRVFFDDLPLAEDGVAPRLERRDGVGIDRDTGTAANGIKYDFQAVPAGTRFALHLQAENLDVPDRALLALVLLELSRGSLQIGGIKSRGLGACRLDALSVRETRFDDPQQMLAFLSAMESDRPGEEKPRAFLVGCVQDCVARAAAA